MRLLTLLNTLVLSAFLYTQHRPVDPWPATFSQVVLSHLVEIRTQSHGCSGVVVATDRVLTARHCMHQAEDIEAMVPGLSDLMDFMVDKQTGGWELDEDEQFDLAVLHVSTSKHPIPLALGSPTEGTPVMAIGFTNSYLMPQSATGHVMSNGFRDFLKIDNVIQRGFSGGPMVNIAGELVGINDMTNFQDHVGYAVPIELIRYFLTRTHVIK